MLEVFVDSLWTLRYDLVDDCPPIILSIGESDRSFDHVTWNTAEIRRVFLDISYKGGTSTSSISIGFSIMIVLSKTNHPALGDIHQRICVLSVSSLKNHPPFQNGSVGSRTWIWEKGCGQTTPLGVDRGLGNHGFFFFSQVYSKVATTENDGFTGGDGNFS